jgi:hypothetical protein
MAIPPVRNEGDSGHIQDHNDISTELSARLPLTGGTLTGSLSGTSATFSGVVSGATPTSNSHLTTKQYVDSADSSKLSLTGGTLTGSLSGTSATFSGVVSAANPTANNHVATKQYVDTVAAGISISRSINTQSSNYTLVATDAEDIVAFNGTATLTIPNDSSVDFSNGTKIEILQLSSNSVEISASSGVEIVNQGDFNTTTAGENTSLELLKYSDNTWMVLGQFNTSSGRAIFGAAQTSSSSPQIQYVTISTLGNGQAFGQLSSERIDVCAVSSSTRGIFTGGSVQIGDVRTNIMDYVTILTLGNATDFGDLLEVQSQSSAASNQTRGLIMGGYNGNSSPFNSDLIQYITIATLGNAANFGLLTTQERTQNSSTSSSIRAYNGGGIFSLIQSSIEYITIATLGNGVNFGNLTFARFNTASCSSATKGFWAGGYTGSNLNNIEYITMTTSGNSVDFGDLTTARGGGYGTSGRTRGLFTYVDGIDYIYMPTNGNAKDFGDLQISQQGAYVGACSNAHGGLQ